MTYQNQLNALIQAVSTSHNSFWWFNKKSFLTTPKYRTAFSTPEYREILASELAKIIYSNFYTQGIPVKTTPVPLVRELAKKTSFLADLASANNGTGYLDKGWKISLTESKQTTIRKGALRLIVKTSQLHSKRGAGLEVGSEVSIRMPNEMPSISPGYYVFVGNAGDVGNKDSVIRLYFNLNAGGGIQFVRTVSRVFNTLEISFKAKVLSEQALYRRCDAAVLYIDKSQLLGNLYCMRELHLNVINNLRDSVPAFTKLLTPGVSFAEDPANGTSFGDHISQILAKALINTGALSKRPRKSTLEHIARHLDSCDIDIERPYLKTGTTVTHYELSELVRVMQPAPLVTIRQLGKKLKNETSYRALACGIGDMLIDRAICSSGECNWVTRHSPTYFETLVGQEIEQFKTMDYSYYRGLAGVAVFLCNLFCETQQQKYKNMSLAAIKGAIRRAKLEVDTKRYGLISGIIGVAISAHYINVRCEDEALNREAQELTSILVGKLNLIFSLTKEKTNYFEGSAGIIVGLLKLNEMQRYIKNTVVLSNDDIETLCHITVRSFRYDGLDSKSSVKKEQLNRGLLFGEMGRYLALLKLYKYFPETEFLDLFDSWIEKGQLDNFISDYEKEHWLDSERKTWIARPALSQISVCEGLAGILIVLSQRQQICITPAATGQLKRVASILLMTLEEYTLFNDESRNLTGGMLGVLDALSGLSPDILKSYPKSLQLIESLKERHLAMVNNYDDISLDPNYPLGLFDGLAGLGTYYLTNIRNERVFPAILQY